MCSATDHRPQYPNDWAAIATAIKARAGWRCEHCHHPHDPDAGYTLTVHHIDGNPFNNDPSNTRALCQRCHLRAARSQLKYGRDHQQQTPLFDTKGHTP
jgi:5-methylcytosine-specific restriction endonuclease McrA